MQNVRLQRGKPRTATLHLDHPGLVDAPALGPLRGRVNAVNAVNAVNMLFIGSSNERGEFRAGTSAAWLGAVPAAIFGGLCTLGVVAGWMWAFPSLRKVDQFEEAAEASGTRPAADA